MKKRKLNKYRKEHEAITEKHGKLIASHISRIFMRYAEDIWKLNKEYFEEKKNVD